MAIGNETLILCGYVCTGCYTRYAERQYICVKCWRDGCFVPDFQRRTDRLAPATRRKFTAKELAAQDQSTFSLAAYPAIKAQSNAFGILHGAPCSGKSTAALRIAEGQVPSVFFSCEMGAGAALSEYLRRLEIRSDDLQIIEPTSTSEIFEIAASGVKCLVIDSLTVLSLIPDDVLAIVRGNNVLVIGILQETKSGIAAGSNSWLHAADFIIKCDALKWTLEKSRYQSLGVSGEVLT